MAKKEKKHEDKNSHESEAVKAGSEASPEKTVLEKLPKDVQEKLKGIKAKLDKFQKKILEKFDKYIVGITLLPPQKPAEQQQDLQQGQQQPDDKDKISVLVLVDDSDSKKMSKFELRDKLSVIIGNLAKEIDKNLIPQVIIISELWQNCYDGKYEVLQMIALSAPIFDKDRKSVV